MSNDTAPTALPDNKQGPKPAVEPEPQNALTRKFTEAEWAAVKEFRTNLTLYLENAFPGKPDAGKAPFNLWGVHIDPLRVDDARVSVILLKFLRARNLNVEQASQMFVATLKWREEFRAADAAKEEFPEDVFGKLGYVYGKDKDGRPITYNIYGGNTDLKAVFGDVDRFMRWRVGLMERGIRQIDFETVDSMVQVHDYEGVGMSSRDANSKKAAKDATKLFQDYYPELLYKKFFVNVPTFLTWIYWIFKPIVSSATFAKLVVVGTGPDTIGRELLQYIPEKELPKKYGGGAEAF